MKDFIFAVYRNFRENDLKYLLDKTFVGSFYTDKGFYMDKTVDEMNSLLENYDGWFIGFFAKSEFDVYVDKMRPNYGDIQFPNDIVTLFSGKIYNKEYLSRVYNTFPLEDHAFFANFVRLATNLYDEDYLKGVRWFSDQIEGRYAGIVFISPVDILITSNSFPLWWRHTDNSFVVTTLSSHRLIGDSSIYYELYPSRNITHISLESLIDSENPLVRFIDQVEIKKSYINFRKIGIIGLGLYETMAGIISLIEVQHDPIIVYYNSFFRGETGFYKNQLEKFYKFVKEKYKIDIVLKDVKTSTINSSFDILSFMINAIGIAVSEVRSLYVPLFEDSNILDNYRIDKGVFSNLKDIVYRFDDGIELSFLNMGSLSDTFKFLHSHNVDIAKIYDCEEPIVIDDQISNCGECFICREREKFMNYIIDSVLKEER